MQLTIDSNQPLDDVLRVVGALYNTNVQVVTDAAPAPASGRSTRSARAPRTRARAASARRGRESTSAVRTWAHEHGFEVASRGRIPQSVVDAYRKANR